MADIEEEPLHGEQHEHFTTFRLANGEAIYGEYAFMTDVEAFEETADDGGEVVEVVKEEWRLHKRTMLIVKPNGYDELQAELKEEEGETAPG